MTTKWKSGAERRLAMLAGIWCCVLIFGVAAMAHRDSAMAREGLMTAGSEIGNLTASFALSPDPWLYALASLIQTVDNHEVRVKALQDQVRNQQSTIDGLLRELSRAEHPGNAPGTAGK